MATSSLTNFIGPLFYSNKPPTAADIGKPLEAGMVYIDSDGTDDSFCAYNGSAWDCILLNAAQPTTTSTSTTTTSTSTTTTG